jgi:DNA modification methylase
VNKLWYGDNLTIMQNHMGKHSVDLIYLDPPFNSKQSYNLLYKTMTGKPVPEQVEAFCDTWEMDAQKEAIARTMPVLMREHGVDDYYVDFWRLWMQALRTTQPHLLAYLIFMVQRLLHMKSILRPTGSIYLHCDPTASHYIKVMMDGIFGHENFRNEIIWKRTSAHSSARRFGPVHDTILFYTISDRYTWNRTEQTYDAKYIATKYRQEDARGRYRLADLTAAGTRSGDSGKPWRGVDPTPLGRHWATPIAVIASLGGASSMSTQDKLDLLDANGFIYWPPGRGGKPGFPQIKRHLTGGQSIQDVIDDIAPINSMAKERLGYPTQKPVALLDRLITASTSKGDIVFDPFCGCGTTIYSAIKNERRWIGCDIAILSIKLIREVLSERFRLVEGAHYTVDGIPTSVEGAQELFNKDPSTFQSWFVERVGGFPMQRKSADRGIDGRIYFETRNGLREMMLQVKGGKHVRPTDIRDLRGVLEREPTAEMAGFLSLTPATKAMREEAAEAGTYEYAGVHYPRIQFLTVGEVLEEKREFHMPARVNTRISTGQQALAL